MLDPKRFLRKANFLMQQIVAPPVASVARKQNCVKKCIDPEHAGRQKAVVKQKATSCDLCTHLKEPSCVYACPHDAAHRVDPTHFFAEIVERGAVK